MGVTAVTTATRARTPAPRRKKDSPNGAPQIKVEDFPYEFQIVDLGETFVDEVYQRPLSSFSEKIKANFKPHLVGTLVISERKRGEHPTGRPMAVVDGQTRREGMLHNGLTQAPAIVYRNLSQGEEAMLFSELQRERRNIATYYRFRASLVAGQTALRRGETMPEGAEEAVQIDRIATAVGYVIGPNSSQAEGNQNRAISAIAGLEKLYRRSPELLERVLTVYREAWQERYVPNGELLAGLGWFLDQRPDADDELLARRLSIRTPDELRRRASAMREGVGHSGALSKYMGQVIEGIYKSRSSK